jgi:hypothetical protein
MFTERSYLSGNSDALPVNDNAYIRKTRSRTLLGTTKGRLYVYIQESVYHVLSK